ncbi:hypothetical protein KUTeg_020459 [Tegillarca granosa]|uniref:Egg coat matrix protein n=1 Tax=Tegillarca granosa TaxID=220873 RepID=A0ABQ9EC54_TEGGR|nr:hypothetical protein KUTeg_020459 [Tegillarca granosa]
MNENTKTSVNYTFHLYHKCQKNCVTVGSIFEFFVDVSTERDTNPGPAVFEFPVPANLNDTNFSVCNYEIINIGKNVICVNSAAAIADSNLTTLADGTYSRVRMSISPLCNVYLVDDENADNFTIRVTVKINMNDTTTEDGLFEWFGFGGKYSTTQIWVAQYKILVKGPTYYPDLALLEGIAINSVDAANISWPGKNEIQISYDGEVYTTAQFIWPTPTSNGSHDIYMISNQYLVSYLRMIISQCDSGCFVEHEFISKTLEGYLEIFNDQTGNYKRQFAMALDNNLDSCFSLPLQGTIPPVYWARFNTTLLQVTPQSFNFTITGEGISCNPSAWYQGSSVWCIVTFVSYPKSPSVGKFHGDLQFCTNTQSGTSDGKSTCVYECYCPDEGQCSEIYIFMANAEERETSPWTLCEMSAMLI